MMRLTEKRHYGNDVGRAVAFTGSSSVNKDEDTEDSKPKNGRR